MPLRRQRTQRARARLVSLCSRHHRNRMAETRHLARRGRLGVPRAQRRRASSVDYNIFPTFEEAEAWAAKARPGQRTGGSTERLEKIHSGQNVNASPRGSFQARRGWCNKPFQGPRFVEDLPIRLLSRDSQAFRHSSASSNTNCRTKPSAPRHSRAGCPSAHRSR